MNTDSNFYQVYHDNSALIYKVLLETFLGVSSTGFFYGWGALSDEINIAIDSHNPNAFNNQHGTFLGVVALVLSVGPMPLVYLLIEYKYATDFQVHAFGIILLPCGLILGGVALRFKILWLLYMSLGVLCGLGGLLILCRIVFNHQLWFSKIGLKNLGSGIIGFFIGLWAVFFFAISVPLRDKMSTPSIFYVYSAILVVVGFWPLFSINDIHLDVQTSSVENISIDNPRINRIEGLHRIESNSYVNSNGPGTPSSQENGIPFSQSADDHMECDNKLPTVPYDHPTTNSHPIPPPVAGPLISSVEIDSYPLTTTTLLQRPHIWILIVFQAAMLTPGWGVKLSAFSILTALFHASRAQSSAVASAYMSCYAIGRLLCGFIAYWSGTRRAYDVVMGGTLLLLVLLAVLLRIPLRGLAEASLCVLFSVFICLVGLLYGGGHALFYALVMDIFGSSNYKLAFSLTSPGYMIAVVVGGLSSAYSFAVPRGGSLDEESDVKRRAEMWFYAMASCIAFGWILLYCLRPFDYRSAAAAASVVL